MKSRLLTLCLAVIAMAAMSTVAMARPYGPGGWLNGVPQEKQEQVAKIYAEGRQKLYELESRKWAKQAELNAVLAAEKPESGKIEALAKEIGTLSSMVYQERVALQQRIFKETGVKLPLAGGGGRGGCPGGGGYGYGPGGCPMAGGYGQGAGGCPKGGGYGAGPQAQGAVPPCCPQGQQQAQ